MTRRYTGAEARELAAKATPGRWMYAYGHAVIVDTHTGERVSIARDATSYNGPLLAAAPDLAESLAAVEAERDALRAAIRTHREAMVAHRAAVLDAQEHDDNTDLEDAAHDARDRLKTTREALFALVPDTIAALREAAK